MTTYVKYTNFLALLLQNPVHAPLVFFAKGRRHSLYHCVKLAEELISLASIINLVNRSPGKRDDNDNQINPQPTLFINIFRQLDTVSFFGGNLKLLSFITSLQLDKSLLR